MNTRLWDNPSLHTLAWTLLHLLWQGALVAGLLAVALVFLRKRSPNARYLAACVALSLFVVLPTATYFSLGTAQSPTSTAIAYVSESVSHGSTSLLSSLTPYLPWLVLLWSGGVVLLSLRLLCGWVGVYRLGRVQTQAVSLDLCHRAEQLAQQLGIARPVQVLASGIAEVPMTFGMLRQVVLLPVSAIAGLTPQMLEAVIAHELAHIRRYDYVVNLFQTVLETLFFYHPAVWWISKQIRNERENACDDMAVALLGNRVHYVRALTQMEELRAVPASPALAFTQGDLLTRVQRILGVPATPKRVSLLHALSTLGIVVSVFGVLFYASAKPVAAKKSVPTLEVSDVPTHSAHPVPTDLEPVLQSEAVPHPKPVAKAVKHPKLVSAHPSPKANATHPLEEALPSNWKEYLKKEIEKPDVAEAEEDVPEWVKPIVKKAKTEIVEGLVNNTLSKSTLKLAMQAAKDGLQKAKEEMRKSSKQAKTEQVKALKEAESEIQKAFAEIDQ